MKIIIGNLLSILALIFSYLEGRGKNKRDIIVFDTCAATSYALSDYALEGYSGVAINVVAILRNLVTMFLPDTVYLGWFFVILSMVCGVYFNNLGLIGFLPVLSSTWYSICIINKNIDARFTKISFVINMFCFGIYCFYIANLVGTISNVFIIFTTLQSLAKEKKEQKG